MQMRQEILTWEDVDQLIDYLIPQFEIEFNAMLIITRGGIIPGGMLAEAMDITHVLTAAVDFPAEIEREKSKLFPGFAMLTNKFFQLSFSLFLGFS